MTALGPITHLTIHCAATPEGRDVKAATVEQWDIAKFGQVSYHHIVELDGIKHTSLEDDQLGCHVHLHNHGNIGVCYVGGCDSTATPRIRALSRRRRRCSTSSTTTARSTRASLSRPPRLAGRPQGLPELQRKRLAR
jgi:hypothetical protein